MTLLNELELKAGVDAVVLINSSDITLVTDVNTHQFSARNRLACQILSIQHNANDVDVTVLLPSGETLIANITPQGLQNMQLSAGMAVWAVFKSNVPHLGVRE
jgi:molybdate transport system regulatory protein